MRFFPKPNERSQKPNKFSNKFSSKKGRKEASHHKFLYPQFWYSHCAHFHGKQADEKLKKHGAAPCGRCSHKYSRAYKLHASYHIDDDKMIILLDFIAFAVRVEMRKRMRIGLMQKPNIKHFL